VFLVLADGKKIPCRVHRDASFDRPGLKYWRAVPEREVELGTYVVELAVLPARSAFWVDIPLHEGGLGAIGKPGQ
jgi:hypothetical protein